MNEQLLRFQPEPFEINFDFEQYGTDQEYNLEETEQESETEFKVRRSSPRPISLRRTPSRTPRISPRKIPRQVKFPTPVIKSNFLKKLDTFPKFPTYVPFPTLPLFPPVWPPVSSPEKIDSRDSRGSERGDGTQGSNQPPETEPRETPNEYIRWVQSCLNQAMGLRLVVGGIMNVETRSAVRSFQKSRGLRSDGLVGPDTEQALKDACKAATPPEPTVNEPISEPPSAELPWGYETFDFDSRERENEFSEMEPFEYLESEVNRNSSDYIRWVQESLNKVLGLKLKIDGIMGPQVRSALRAFQKRNGITDNGIADLRTETKLKTLISTSMQTPKTTRAILPQTRQTLVSKSPTRSAQLTEPQVPPYTQCDFIDQHIDVTAQYALYMMLRRDPQSKRAAVGILAAVRPIPPAKAILGGVYRATQRVPAMRARGIGRAYWELIPPGRLAVYISEPKSELPIIVFRESFSDSPSDLQRLGDALREVWIESRLPNLVPPAPTGKQCSRPPPPPTPPLDGKQPDQPTEACRYPQCDPSVPTTVSWACGQNKYSVAYDCVPVPGDKCGICEGASKNADRCFEENERRERIERQKCRDEYSPGSVFKYILTKCGPAAAKCLLKEDPIACLKTAKCFLDPEPLNRYQECLKRESKRYIDEGQRCRALP